MDYRIQDHVVVVYKEDVCRVVRIFILFLRFIYLFIF